MGFFTEVAAAASPLRARRAALAILAALPVASCALLQGARQLPYMTSDEVDAYGTYLGGQLAAVAEVAITSEEMSLDQLMATSIAIENVAMGKVAPLASQLFDPGPLGALALTLTLNDIHYQLTMKGGVLPGGQLLPSAGQALMMVSTALKDLHKKLQAEGF